MGSSSIYLPDLIKACPFTFATNPNYAEIAPQSSAWFDKFNAVTSLKRSAIIQASSELLSSYAYPYAGPEAFRTCCDFVTVLFALDEITDDEKGVDALTTGQRFLKVLESKPHDEHVISRLSEE